MTTVIIKQATIHDTTSPFHLQKMDVKIDNGIITEISANITAKSTDKVVEHDDLHISQGWIDSSVCFGEPGFEDSETIKNGLLTAAKSGFTAVALQPNTLPVLDNQAQIKFVLDKAKENAVNLYPIGALTQNSEGNDLAELFDMKNAGAIAFGDYNKALQNANLQKIALQYVQDFDGLVISFCQDNTIKGKGIVNEGTVSTSLGLKGIPALAEELHVARNLFLLEYTGGKLHIPTISTQKSIELIKEAKAKGLQVTCSVAVHHLVLTDNLLNSFDSRYKVIPPLRDEATRNCLIDAVLDGTIDCITTDHNPVDIEHKKLEFDLAKDGTIGLESAFGALQTVLPLDVILEKLTAARALFNIESNTIEVGKKADLSFFTTENEWIFKEKNIYSKSKNSAFVCQTMKGKALGIYNNGQLVIDN